MNPKFLLMGTIAIALAATTACSGGASTESSDDSPSASEGLEEIKSTSPLFISVVSKYDGTEGAAGPETYHGVCNIDPDNLAANDTICNITIPEGMLHYSDLTFEYGTGNASLCPRIEFYPYYRRLSTSAAYTPYKADSAIDCTDATLAECYDGAAVDIVPEFPKNIGLWFPTDTVTSLTATVNSAWSAESFGNTHTCNNL